MSPILKKSFQGRGLGRSLLILLLLLAGLGQLHANFNVKITKVVLPIQQYAAIDLSGSVQGDNDVDMIALDDANNAAYEFCTGIGYTYPVGQDFNTWAAAAGIFSSYTWNNGASSPGPTQPVIVGANNPPTYVSYSPASLTTYGIMSFNTSKMEVSYDSNGLVSSQDPNTGGLLPPLSRGSIGTPFPYLFSDGNPPLPGGVYINYDNTAVSPNGQNIADAAVIASLTNGDQFYEGFLYINGQYTSFDANSSYITGSANVTLISQSFVPNGINDNGWAIGRDSTFSYALVWNGSYLNNLGLGYPTGINNQNQVIVDGYDGNWNFLGGYLWDNGPQTALWDVLPTMTQHQYSAGSSTTLSCTIAPYSLSNQKNPATNGGITDTSIQILSTATNAKTGLSENLLFQRDNTASHWATYLQQFPTNVSIIGNPAVNSSGVCIARGTIAGGNGIHALLMVPVDIVPDYNRDGFIDNSDYSKITTNNPYRFWIDDSGEKGDIAAGDNDIPGSGGNNLGPTLMPIVNGKEDLINYFPLYLDISKLVKLLPPGGTYTYSLSQADSAVDVVFTDLAPKNAGGFLTNNAASSMLDNTTNLSMAPRAYLTSAGTNIPAAWLNGIGDTNTAGGVILVNAIAKTANPLVLSVNNGSQQVARVEFPLSIDTIDKMYRWINLRDVTQGGVTRSTTVAPPSNYPDSLCNGKMFVFVHGYNVSEAESTAWCAEAFKRLYQSGAKSMFTGVCWTGNVSQEAGVSPNYWINVVNAFNTSQALANAVNALPGSPTTIAAHSLGNMVVSSAISDWGLNVDNYFMLDAAMPMEAFDASAIQEVAMTYTGYGPAADPGWINYNHNRWASYWHTLFTPPDGRCNLTWNNRFTNVIGQVNFFSSGEDVLDNASGTVATPGAELAWADQEMTKGTSLQAFGTYVGTFSGGNVICQGGWGLNPYWGSINTSGELNSPIPVQSALFQNNTFFTPFTDGNLSGSNGSAEAAQYSVRAQTLAEAIPALSFAVGRNLMGKFGNNNNDMVLLEDGWPTNRPIMSDNIHRHWFHGDAKDVAYPFTHKLWQTWVTLGQLNK